MIRNCSGELWKQKEDKVVLELSKHKTTEHSENWIFSVCPNCNTGNWALMSVRYEACKCHNCQTVFWLNDKIYQDYKTELTMSKIFDYEVNQVENIFSGLPKPDCA
jgi:hypothetical protein